MDKNIIELHPKDMDVLQKAIDGPPQENGGLKDLMAAPGLPEVGNLGFADMEAAFNMRAWLQKACEAQGAKMTGGGFGGGVADISIELEGHNYWLTIKAF